MKTIAAVARFAVACAAVQEQLGLKLEPRKVPGSLFVIDSARKPSEN